METTPLPVSEAHGKQFLRSLFRRTGRRPSRARGQNFITDPNLLDFIVRSAGIGPADAVLEVGVGTGQMTARSAAIARAVVGVEIDRALFSAASEALARFPNVRLINADALARKDRLDPEFEKAAREAGAAGPLLHVSNLPYRIAAPLVLTMFESGLPIARTVATVPLELAERLCAAAPGDPGYGGLSILARFHSKGAILRKVPPEVFWPRPEVMSAVLRLDTLPKDARPLAEYRRLRDLVRAVFTQRRKTMARSMETLGFVEKGGAPAVLRSAGIDPRARPEEIGVEAFARLVDSARGRGSVDK